MTEVTGFRSYVAIGDSFTEGVGDERDDGRVRGWADLVALGFALASDEPVLYANLAIRGRKLKPLLDEQLQPAIQLRPELISINGGGNDILRPRVQVESIARLLLDSAAEAVATGSHVLLLSGANPSRNMPLGSVFSRRGTELDDAVRAGVPADGVTFVDNWVDEPLGDIRYWSADKLHLNALGHARVASNVLTELQVPVPAEWGIAEVETAPAGERGRGTFEYYRRFVLPWVGRRLTGRSSGDGRTAKIAELIPVDPTQA